RERALGVLLRPGRVPATLALAVDVDAVAPGDAPNLAAERPPALPFPADDAAPRRRQDRCPLFFRPARYSRISRSTRRVHGARYSIDAIRSAWCVSGSR